MLNREIELNKHGVSNIHDFRYNNVRYFLHHTEKTSKQWLLTCFNFDITNHPLSDDLNKSKKQAKIILKRNMHNNKKDSKIVSREVVLNGFKI